GKPIHRLSHTHRPRGVAFSPDGTRVVSTGSDGGRHLLSVWNAREGLFIRSFAQFERYGSAAFSPDGNRIVLADGSGLWVWDATADEMNPLPHREVPQAEGHNNAVYRVAISPDGTRIVSASWDQTLIVWDVETGGPIHRLNDHTSKVLGVDYSPDGTHVA